VPSLSLVFARSNDSQVDVGRLRLVLLLFTRTFL
jgi:hypothetical protein